MDKRNEGKLRNSMRNVKNHKMFWKMSILSVHVKNIKSSHKKVPPHSMKPIFSPVFNLTASRLNLSTQIALLLWILLFYHSPHNTYWSVFKINLPIIGDMSKFLMWKTISLTFKVISESTWTYKLQERMNQLLYIWLWETVFLDIAVNFL